MRNIFCTLFSLFILASCATWKKDLRTSGDYQNAINNAVIDFSSTSSLAIQDSSFSIIVNEKDTNIISVGILGTIEKFKVIKTGFSSNFPSRYIEYNSRLYYWWDDNYPVNDEIIRKLNEYNLIETLESLSDAVFKIDDAKKGKIYFFCRENLLNYKKMKTNGAFGNINVPNLNCSTKRQD